MMHKRKTKWRKLKLITKLATGLALLISLGFGAYIIKLPMAFSHTGAVTNSGLVVLTGGSGRIGGALKQIELGYTGPILITGVHPSVTKNDLFAGKQLQPAQLNRITLDYVAQTTRQNVLVAQEWARQQGISDAGLITSHYHMPRSVWLFQLFAPYLKVEPMPVVPVQVSLGLLVREYLKLLVAPLLP